MHHAVNLDARDRCALKRGQQNAAQSVAERGPEPALKRLNDELRPALRVVIVLHHRTIGADQVFPVLVVNRSGGCRHGLWPFRLVV